MAKACVLEQASRHVDFVLAHQDAARKNADRALQNAHILIRHDMPDPRTIEQRFNCRDQDGIGRADEFAQIQLLFHVLRAGAMGGEIRKSTAKLPDKLPANIDGTKLFPLGGAMGAGDPAQRNLYIPILLVLTVRS
jgi:hypothetical protein